MVLKPRPCLRIVSELGCPAELHLVFLVQCPWSSNIVLDPTIEQYGFPAEARIWKLRHYTKHRLIRKTDCDGERFTISDRATVEHEILVRRDLNCLVEKGNTSWLQIEEELLRILHDWKQHLPSAEKLWEFDKEAFAPAKGMLLDLVRARMKEIQDEQILV